MTIQTTIIFDQQTKMNRTYKNNVGLELVFDVGIKDITSSKIFYQKPDGSTGEWISEQYDTDKIKYVTILNDLDQNGFYILEPYIETNTQKLYGKQYLLNVKDTI